jgi:HSP20 family molecular chaperone IbpA
MNRKISLHDAFGILANPYWPLDEFTNNIPKTEVKLSPINYKWDVVDGKLEIAFSVIGHEPKNVNVELTESKLFIKATAPKDDKSVDTALINDIDEVLKLSKEYDGLSAKAKINNGVLRITVDKKEEAKPKKLSIKF